MRTGSAATGLLRWIDIEMNVASLQIFLVPGGGLMCAAIDIHYRVNAVKKMERRLIAGTVAVLLFGGGG